MVISASHNPPEYNGVKFFDGDGGKLTDAAEEKIEALLDEPPRAEEQGGIDNLEVVGSSYVRHVVERFGGDLTGLKLAVDCANGDAETAEISPEALDDVLEVAVVRDVDPVKLAAAGCVRLEQRLDLLLALVGQLLSRAVEELDAVVLRRIVRCGDHRADVEREQCDGRCRKHTAEDG